MQIYQLGKTWFSEKAGGGSDRVFAALQEHLPGTNTNVHGVVLGEVPSNGSTVNDLAAVSTEDTGLFPRWWAIRRHVKDTLPAFDPDVVTSHFALYTLPVLDIFRDHPFVVHFHGPWAEESAMEGESEIKTRLKAQIERLVYSQGDRFIVLSPAFRNVLSSRYGIDEDRIHIVPGGVDVKAYDTGYSRVEARKYLGWPTDRPIILSVRRLVSRVGLEGLIDSMRRVRRAVPDVLLMIAGKGPLRSKLELMIDDYNLSSNVRLLGFVPETDLATTYRAADLSVMPTMALEGFGLSAVESLAAGTPVIATPVGGIPSILHNLSPDLLFEDTDPRVFPPQLIAALTGSLNLPDARTCQSYAAEHFDWPVIARQTQVVYQAAADA